MSRDSGNKEQEGVLTAYSQQGLLTAYTQQEEGWCRVEYRYVFCADSHL